jgi:hypothetical protein
MRRLARDFGWKDVEIAKLKGLELGSLCSRCKIIENGKVSLSELVIATMKHQLNKDDGLRLSKWSSATLADEQITYAALDAWASLQVFKAAILTQKEGAILATVRHGMPVSITMRKSATIIGEGTIDEVSDPTLGKPVKARAGRSLVNVSKITIPGVIVPLYRKPFHSLGDYVYFDHADLRIRVIRDDPELPQKLGNTPNCLHADLEADGSTSAPSPGPSRTQSGPYSRVINSISGAENSKYSSGAGSSSDSSDSSDSEESDDHDYVNADDIENSSTNSALETAVASTGVVAMNDLNTPSPISPTLHSRVLEDIFHVMNRLKLKKTHSLSREFMRRMRDAIFLLDKEDVAAVKKVLESQMKLSWNKALRYKSDWLWKRIRRYVPPPEILTDRLTKLFQTMGVMECSKTNEKLFSRDNWKESENILNSAARGYLSDPPGESLYYKISVDHFGLSLYRCIRGTNSVEGGVHQKIRRWFGAFNASPEFGDCVLVEFRTRHNFNV